jgi:transposase
VKKFRKKIGRQELYDAVHHDGLTRLEAAQRFGVGLRTIYLRAKHSVWG